MVLFLSEDNLREALKIDDAIPALELALQMQGEGKVSMPPRMKVQSGAGRLMVMPVSIEGMGYIGMKAYTVFQNVSFLVLLYSSTDGSLLAIMDADYLGQVRTGAVSAVATKYMTSAAKCEVGIIGSGTQARTQLEALHSIGRLGLAKVFSPNKDHRESYAKEMTKKLGVEIKAVDSTQNAVEKAEIVCYATSSLEPVAKSDWLRPGCHINAIGSVLPTMRELDDGTIGRASMLVVDSKEQVLAESGDFIVPVSKGLIRPNEIIELSDLVLGRAKRRVGDLTIFKSVGTALQDIATASAAFQSAIARGLGMDVGKIATRKAVAR